MSLTDIFTDDASNYDSSFDFDGIKASSDEINVLQYAVKGTVVNGKGVIYGDSGELNAGILQIAGTSITSTASELNILDGVTATATELNIMDGDTSASSTTLVDADRVFYK